MVFQANMLEKLYLAMIFQTNIQEKPPYLMMVEQNFCQVLQIALNFTDLFVCLFVCVCVCGGGGGRSGLFDSRQEGRK